MLSFYLGLFCTYIKMLWPVGRGIMTLCNYELQCKASAMIYCGDTRSLLLAWDITFCGSILCGGQGLKAVITYFCLNSIT